MSDKNIKSSYADSGVNIDAGNEFVSKIKSMVESTFNSSVIGGIGGFAGMFDISSVKDMEYPVLVSSTDGVGTKLKVAIDADELDTVGIDLVAMSVNDLIVTGAKPLFFLDYIATGKLSTDKMSSVVEGIVAGCHEANVALLGGETAEMPGMYAAGDFDLAGFAVGVLDKAKIIDGSKITEGDCMIGLSSSGFHSNGYSLLRKVLFEDLKMKIDDPIGDYDKVSDMLLEPTKIYVEPIMKMLESGLTINGMVHITGGGFYDNIPRVLPKGLSAELYLNNFPTVEAIATFQAVANVDPKELYRVFNMGVGFVLVVPESTCGEVMAFMQELGEEASLIGRVTLSASKDESIVDIIGL